jgi:D-alanyl-D-alanine carboxypeptidase (penicillin-binding protein 5/6)
MVELIKGIAVVSGNDACIAAAEKLSGDEQAFVDRMNRKAQALGLKNTLFQTADGWPADGQYTTAHDMAMLAQAYVEKHPQALAYHKLKEFTHADIVLHNRNRLVMQDPTVDGLKTGHIEEAGFHLVATAQRDGRRLTAVVMGASDIDTREKEAMQLLEFGFDSVATVRLFDKGDTISNLTVLNGLKSEVGLVPTEEGRVDVPLGHQSLVAYRIDAAVEREAPVDPEQPAGSVVITYRGEVVQTIPLVASEKIERAPAADAKEGVKKAAAPGENERTTTGDLKAPPAAPGTFFFLGRTVLLAVLAVLFLLLLIQWIYIAKLRGRMARSSAVDSEVVKQRLEKIIQKH